MEGWKIHATYTEILLPQFLLPLQNRCGSVDLRTLDIKKISASVKSWLFADQLEHPEEFVLHRPRRCGGLGLINVKYKAMAELTRSFCETAVNPSFITNSHHHALYLWNVQEMRNSPEPLNLPYMSEELWQNIRRVKAEGLMNMSKLTSGQWYKLFLENNVTMQHDSNDQRSLKPCRAELANPDVDWEQSWQLACLPGLSSEDQTFLWKMLHNILPSQSRLYRLKMKNAPTPYCTACDRYEEDVLHHALLTCPMNNEVAGWLMDTLRPHIPGIIPQKIVLLNLGVLDDSLQLAAVWLISNVLSQIWKTKEKRKPQPSSKPEEHLKLGSAS